MRTCLALLVVGLFALDERESWTTVSAADRPGLPDNINISETLRGLALEMLEGSPTFRHQCRRLGMIRALRVPPSILTACAPPSLKITSTFPDCP